VDELAALSTHRLHPTALRRRIPGEDKRETEILIGDGAEIMANSTGWLGKL
jgi:hypothetical protein